MSSAISTALSGLNDSVLRVSNAISNIVNSSSTARLPPTPADAYDGFRPQDVVTLSDSAAGQTLGVHSTLRPRAPAYAAVPDPKSPLANAEGLVAAPNVDIATELVNIKLAQVTYRASAAAIKASLNNDEVLLDTLA
jgi:flagellar basal-body rod protein FlgC